MLNIITGRTGSGKTRLMRSLAAESARQGEGKTVIIVPEQFSFETERAMLRLLGNGEINNVQVLSFSRIAERLLEEHGKLSKPVADDKTKTVLLSLAVESVSDSLIHYAKAAGSVTLNRELLDFYRELKKCRITPDDLEGFSALVKKKTFSQKLSELALIFNCYEAMLSGRFEDDWAYLDTLCSVLDETGYFDGKNVFCDGFSGFSAQEYHVLEKIISKARETYVSFCCDTEKNHGRYELFYNSYTEIKKLKATAAKAGVKVAPEKRLEINREYKAEQLNILEENLFSAEKGKYEGDFEGIYLAPCKTMLDECDFVASQIKRLVREEGYRYRDIAVIERTEGSYKGQLLSSFRKYGVDCFDDSRVPVVNQPLAVFLDALFDMLISGFQTETVLRFLKTGLYGFTVEEIAQIEDYCLAWRIGSSAWQNEWTENPDGFGEAFNDSARERLFELNSLREKIVGPVLSLKNRLAESDGEVISRELFEFLRRCKADERLILLAGELARNSENALGEEQDRVWKLFCSVFDSLYSSVGKAKITLKRYRELFDILIAGEDLGVIPDGADRVIIGSADRMRATAPKAVFAVGANSGVFPAECGSGVLLTDAQRCELIENGAPLISNLEYNSVSEYFIAYRALTLATDRLYVSYSALSAEGEEKTPSEIVSEIKLIFPNCRVYEYSDEKSVESRASAFSAFARCRNDATVFSASLEEFFTRYPSGEREKLEKTKREKFSIKSAKTAQKLFGRDMYISATKTEKFYKCPFEYFCEYGIKAKPKREAQIDPAQTGTVVHFVLENFLRENPKSDFVRFSKQQLREKIFEIVDRYVNEFMGGTDKKDASFLRTVQLIKNEAVLLALQLVKEFSQSKFVPVDFELKINNDGDIMPYLVTAPDGSTVKIIGSVDRVDRYRGGAGDYIRIIDYKTGGKDFDLSEVFSGLNMQMLIYLFAIAQNGGDRYGNIIPAGILYFQAKAPRITKAKSDRNADVTEAEAVRQKAFKMTGMVLNNTECITAMENEAEGIFIPASLNADGTVKGNVISLDTLRILSKKVDSMLGGMAVRLHSGDIEALPVDGACDYCKYSDICRREEGAPVRETEKLNFQNALQKLKEEELP